jgi:hypothetical protein
MFSFCSHEVKPHPPTGSLFFPFGRPARSSRRRGAVDVGEKDLPEGGRFWRTELAERGNRSDQAMISGVI